MNTGIVITILEPYDNIARIIGVDADVVDYALIVIPRAFDRSGSCVRETPWNPDLFPDSLLDFLHIGCVPEELHAAFVHKETRPVAHRDRAMEAKDTGFFQGIFDVFALILVRSMVNMTRLPILVKDSHICLT
jgi:hypothetical protein